MNKKLIPAYLLTFVNVLGFSILIPVLPFVVDSYQGPKWAYGLLLTLYSAFQFLGAPFLGSLSDSMGRKPVLLISQAGTLLSWVVFLFAGQAMNIPVLGLALPLWIVGISRIMDGLTGGNSSVTNAYVADITTRDEKSYIFGYLGGIAGIGMIVGPALGGFTASSSMGHNGTLLTAIGISLLTLLAIALWLKESLPRNRRKSKKERSALSHVLLFRRIKEIKPKPIIRLLFTVKFFFSVMMAFYVSTIALFMLELFSFDERELGIFLLVVGVFLSFHRAFFSPRFLKTICPFKTLLLGLVFSLIRLLSISVSATLLSV